MPTATIIPPSAQEGRESCLDELSLGRQLSPLVVPIEREFLRFLDTFCNMPAEQLRDRIAAAKQDPNRPVVAERHLEISIAQAAKLYGARDDITGTVARLFDHTQFLDAWGVLKVSAPFRKDAQSLFSASPALQALRAEADKLGFECDIKRAPDWGNTHSSDGIRIVVMLKGAQIDDCPEPSHLEPKRRYADI
jgi:hypothetical protein